MRVFYFRTIAKCILLTLGLIWIVYKITFRKYIISIDSVGGGFREWYQKNLFIVDMCLKCLIAAFFLISFLCFLVPFYLDIPDMVKGNYKCISGTVLSKAYSSRDSERCVDIRNDETGEELSITVFYDCADKGDYIEVEYLEHSKYGVVVKHLKKK